MIINEDYLDSIKAADLDDELNVRGELPEGRDIFTEENEFELTNGLTHLFVFPCSANFGNYARNNPEPVKPSAYKRLMHTLEMLENSGLVTTFTEPYVFVGEFVTAKMKWWQCYPYNLADDSAWRCTKNENDDYSINYFENIKYCIGIGFPEHIDARAIVPFLIAFYRFVYSGLNYNLIRTLQIGINGKKSFEFTDYVEMMTAVLNKDNNKAFACFFNILSKLNGDVPSEQLYYQLSRVLDAKRPALPMMKRIAGRIFDEDEMNVSSHVINQEVGQQLMAEDFNKDDIIKLNYQAHKGFCPYFRFSAMYSGATYGSYPPVDQGSTLLNTYLNYLKSTRAQDMIFVWTPSDLAWIIHIGVIDNTEDFKEFGSVMDLFLIFNCNNASGQCRACIDAMSEIFHNINKQKFFKFMTD